jgi:hypothetical protein
MSSDVILIAGAAIATIYQAAGRLRPEPVNRGFGLAHLLSAGVCGLEFLFGSGAVGALVIAPILLSTIAALFAKRWQEPAPASSAT